MFIERLFSTGDCSLKPWATPGTATPENCYPCKKKKKETQFKILETCLKFKKYQINQRNKQKAIQTCQAKSETYTQKSKRKKENKKTQISFSRSMTETM